MPPYKKQKISSKEVHPDDDDSSVQPGTESELLSEDAGDNDDGMQDASSQSDDDNGIEGLKPQRSRLTSKRKIRATGSSKFGTTLQHLLNTQTSSSLPLSLKPSIARKRNDEKLELRAKKVLQVEKKGKEDLARITDVIGGWGGESERALRKVAQRGVVRLFNVIQQSQASAVAADEEAKANRGSGKPTLSAPALESKGKSKGKHKDNIIGRGKESNVDKEDFFNMIKSGGVVSKA